MRIGELGMSSWRAKHGRDVVTYFRMAMIPCAPYIVPALFECCMYFLITHENENAIITIYFVALLCTMIDLMRTSDYYLSAAQVVPLLAVIEVGANGGVAHLLVETPAVSCCCVIAARCIAKSWKGFSNIFLAILYILTTRSSRLSHTSPND